MNNTVVLGGDAKPIQQIDGDLHLQLNNDGEAGLLSLIDGDAGIHFVQRTSEQFDIVDSNNDHIVDDVSNLFIAEVLGPSLGFISVDEPADMSLDHIMSGEFGIVTEIHGGSYPAYTGPTTITPSTETQTLATSHTSVLSNITINPVPSNYGRIDWNGSVLTVS